MNTGYEIFSQYYDELTENVDYKKRSKYFHKLIQKHKKSSGNVLLDLACGTGSMTEEMCKLSYDVIGSDYSYGMLNRAMNKKIESGLPIQYICQDMRKLELYDNVDVVICTLDSLNHLDNFSDLQVAFQKVYDNIKIGGVFIFDMNTPYKHCEVLGNQIYIYDTDNVYCVWENNFEPEDNTVNIHLDFFELGEDGKYSRSYEEITEHAYEPEKIQKSLETIGFEVIGCYDADTENPIHKKSERMVFVTRK